MATAQHDGADDWMVEGVAQFLRSPLWTGPVHDFIDEHCGTFSAVSDEASRQAGHGSTGHAVEHQQLHRRFQEIVDTVLTAFIEELGVDGAVLLSTCQKTSHPSGQQILEYVAALDRFETFVRIMSKRNHELELEAMEQLERLKLDSANTTPAVSAAPSANVPPPGGEASEEELIKRAIAASLADANALERKKAEVEDAELQAALQVSLAVEEERMELERAEARRLEEEASAKAAAAMVASASAEKARLEALAAEAEKVAKAEAERVTVAEEESKMRQAAAAEQTLVARREVAQKIVKCASVTAAQAQVPKSSPVPAPALTPVAASVASAKAPTPVDKPTIITPLVVPKFANLPPLGAAGRGLNGDKPVLASAAQPLRIGEQPPLADLVREASDAEVTAPSGGGPSEEEIKARAAYLKAQRDRLVAAKKQQRAEEMKEFTGQAGAPTAPAAPATSHHDEEHKKLTVELARRFRV